MNQLAEAEIEMARHARASATEALERGRQTLREVRENRLLAELGLGSMLPGRSEGTSLLCAEALKRCQQGHSACQRTGQLMDEMVRTVVLLTPTAGTSSFTKPLTKSNTVCSPTASR